MYKIYTQFTIIQLYTNLQLQYAFYQDTSC